MPQDDVTGKRICGTALALAVCADKDGRGATRSGSLGFARCPLRERVMSQACQANGLHS